MNKIIIFFFPRKEMEYNYIDNVIHPWEQYILYSLIEKTNTHVNELLQDLFQFGRKAVHHQENLKKYCNILVD